MAHSIGDEEETSCPPTDGMTRACDEAVDCGSAALAAPAAAAVNIVQDKTDSATTKTGISLIVETPRILLPTSSTKHLRFHDEPTIIEYLPLPSEISSSDKNQMWWNMQDYEEFHLTARSICHEVQRHGQLTMGIDEAYRRAQHIAKTVNEDDLEERVRQLSLDTGLAHWCKHGHSRRGLERWASKVHGRSRGDLAEKAKSQVRNLQGTFSSQEELRDEAEKRSRIARVFARMMGEADAVAAVTQLSTMRRWSEQGSSGPITPAQRARMMRTSSLPQTGLVRTTL